MDLFSCLCSLLCLSAVWAELKLTVVSSKTAILGSDTLLECMFTVGTSHVDLQYLEIIWSFHGKDLLSFSDTLEVFDLRVSIDEAKITDGNASLKLSELKTSHEGEYTCSVIYNPDRKDKTITVNLQAHPRIIVQEPVVIIGKENLLRCSVVGFYPMEIFVFWSRDGQVLPGSSMSQHQRYSNGTFMVNSTVPILPTDNDANHTFSCHVHHSSLERPLQKDVMLLLQEEERSVSVTVVVLSMLAIVVIMAVLGWFLYRRLAHRELTLCEIQGPLTWMVGETVELVCVGNSYPEDIKVTWIKLHKGKETEIEAWTSPTMEEAQPLLSVSRYRAESSKVAGNLTLTSTLFITPSLEEDEGAVFKCRFFTSDDKVKEEKEFKGFKLYDKPQIYANIACVPCDGMNVQCTLDLRHFYPKEIQIKWSSGFGKLEDVSSKECETENADRRTFNVRTECIIPEEAFNDWNFKVRVTWEHASLKAPEYREMSVTDPDFPGRPLLGGIVVPPLIHGYESSLQCRVAEYFPKKLHVQWLKVEKTSGEHFPQYAVGNEVVPQPEANERVNQINTNDDHVPQSDGPVTISNGIYGFVPPSEGISVPSFEFDASEVSVPPSDESDEDVPQSDESDEDVPASDESERPVPQSDESERPGPQSDESERPVPQSDGSFKPAVLSNENGVPVLQSNACASLDHDLSRYKSTCTILHHEPMKGYSCTAFLTFTPDIVRDQGSTFICRVSHPSLKEALEMGTETVTVLSELKVSKLKIEPSGLDGTRTMRLFVLGFYPGKVTVLWTRDSPEGPSALPSELAIVEEADGSYTAVSTCLVSMRERDLIGEKHTMTVTIEHASQREPLKATIRLKGREFEMVSKNFMWTPKRRLNQGQYPSTAAGLLKAAFKGALLLGGQHA